MFDLTKEELSKIIDTSPSVTYVAKAYGDFGAKFVSSNITERCGYTVHECIDNPDFWQDCLHPDEKDTVLAGFQDIFQNGTHTHEYRFRRKDGTYIWVLDEVHLKYDEDGNPYEIIGSWLDITKQKEAEQQLLDSRNLLQEFFLSNPIPTTISTISGDIRYVNPAFSKVSGYKRDEIVGRNSKEFDFWGDLENREKMFSELQRNGFVEGYETTLYWKNRKPFNCLIYSRLVESAEEVLLLSTLTDITSQKKAEEKLRNLDKLKSSFISMAAHELRTPLSSIMGYAELLSDEEMSRNLSNEYKTEFLHDIVSNCEFLSKNIDDLLDVSLIESGKRLSFRKQKIELKPFVSKIIDRFKLTTDHQVDICFEKGFPESFEFDPHRISQVIENILSNSAKYSPPKSLIKIDVRRDLNQCSISIGDQGIGMSTEEISHVFDQFYRADDSETAVRGLGLGMSIVKQIIVDHDGDISIESAPQEGTTVKFRLPLN